MESDKESLSYDSGGIPVEAGLGKDGLDNGDMIKKWLLR